jgi:hypothetical protein
MVTQSVFEKVSHLLHHFTIPGRSFPFWNAPAAAVARGTIRDKRAAATSSHVLVTTNRRIHVQTRLTFLSEWYHQSPGPARGTSIRQVDRCHNEIQEACEKARQTDARPSECPGNLSQLSFARHYKSTNVKPDLQFHRNGTSHTCFKEEERQFGKCSAGTTKSKILVRRSSGERHDKQPS